MLELEELTRRIIGCGIPVHREFGPGLLESCYEAALAIEFTANGIRFVRQPRVAVSYKGRIVGHFRPDFIVEGLVVLELKCVSRLDPVIQAQMLTYLRATGLKVGLLNELSLRDVACRSKAVRLVTRACRSWQD